MYMGFSAYIDTSGDYLTTIMPYSTAFARFLHYSYVYHHGTSVVSYSPVYRKIFARSRTAQPVESLPSTPFKASDT